MYNLVINKKRRIEYLILGFLCISLYFTSKQNYLFFHTITEMATVVLGFTLMLISLGTIKICKNDYYHFLAIIFGFVGVIDLFHVLTYKGISIFSNNSNMPTQLWILSRYYECIMLNLSVLYINKKINFYKVFAINAAVVIISILSITIFNVFPACYIEGYGLTNFKKFSEYLISMGFFIILFLVIKSKRDILKDNKSDLVKAIVLQILCSLSFTLYIDVYGILNLFGHLFKVLSYYYGFKVMFKYIVVNPYSTLFENLNNKVEELENANKELFKANYKVQSIEKLFGKFVNFIPDGILVLRDKKIEFANSRFLNMLKIDEENKLTNMSIFDVVDKSYHEIFDTEIEEAYVSCDPDIIERIMLNILSNAVKYGKEDGTIEVYICQSSINDISILIKDDGIGIPDEMKQKIFNRFLKVDNSLSRKTEGSGIGLALVKQLVEIQQGTITFDSKINCGTEFKITLSTVEYCSEVCATLEKSINYEKNIIQSAEIEFSDIYY